ncbi:hypothetical protein LLB_1101 [Legionella longbeachae D-4968]|nr:hypothetical protein LLB_1101 [Legionella longbeachae D-4968]
MKKNIKKHTVRDIHPNSIIENCWSSEKPLGANIWFSEAKASKEKNENTRNTKNLGIRGSRFITTLTSTALICYS